MWIVFVIGLMIIFYIWVNLPQGVKVLAALFLVLATPFTEGTSFILLAIILTLSSLFGDHI